MMTDGTASLPDQNFFNPALPLDVTKAVKMWLSYVTKNPAQKRRVFPPQKPIQSLRYFRLASSMGPQDTKCIVTSGALLICLRFIP